MADVTDAAFRRVIAKCSAHTRADGTTGGPDVLWTEFVSADGLLLADEEGKQRLLADLRYSEAERPIVAQLFSADPFRMEAAAALCTRLGFDGIDINMGCPDRTVEKQGCGAVLIKNPRRAHELITAAERGAKSAGGPVPISVKTRLGYNADELEEWLPALLSAEPAAITLHARTRKEMSKTPARWERITRAVEIRNEHHSQTLIIGNGDVTDLTDARQKAEESGADGVMLGRAIFGNPWLFDPKRDASTIPLPERLCVMVEHTTLFAELLPHKHFAIMKKHYKAYVQGFPGASELRARLMEAQDAAEVSAVVEHFLRGAPFLPSPFSATLSV